MNRIAQILACIVFLVAAGQTTAQPLLDKKSVDALHEELSGEEAKRNLEYLTRLHRMRGSADFRQAIEFITGKLQSYGLEEVEAFTIPADGISMYGTQKSRPAWDAEFAELWEVRNNQGKWTHEQRIADWSSMPITLAEDSESADVTAELVNVGAGTSDADYAGKDVRGKIVLISASPGAAADLAVGKYGAAGMLSDTQNQLTAWWKEDQNLIRWGHLESFSPLKTFSFMLSLKQGADYRRRLNAGEKIMLHAVVKASRKPGNYNFVTAVIRGADPKLSAEEIAFTCHLDHQRPGANDNASGSVTILEAARTLSRLIREGKLQRPARTLRFIWSPEIEGTSAILSQRPAYATRIKAVVHMDMVGGGPVTKSVFHVAGAPFSLPSFVADVGETFGRFVNEESDRYASGYPHQYTFTSREGGKEPLQAVLGEFHMGSDHDVYQEASFSIPAIYMHDWPDRYIHTNFDLPANIDPTKLKRAGFIGAASGYFLAKVGASDVSAVWGMVRGQAMRRMARAVTRSHEWPAGSAQLLAQQVAYERSVFQSMASFVDTQSIAKEATAFYDHLSASMGVQPAAAPAKGEIVYHRNASVKGPLSVFGYDYLEDHLKSKPASSLKLNSAEGIWGSYYTYEALNLVNGKRTASQIAGILSAEFGPVDTAVVAEYLAALEEAGVIHK